MHHLRGYHQRMTDTATATVEVLTAEVRVLMIGSRQITLSVVRQLDFADPDEIAPFGRVRTGAYDNEVVEVVGSVRGVLARARATSARLTCKAFGSRCPDYSILRSRREAEKADDGPALNALVAHQDHQWVKYRPDPVTFKVWSELPLIVLAGLR